MPDVRLPSLRLTALFAWPALMGCGSPHQDDVGFANEAADALESILVESSFFLFDATAPESTDACTARAAALAAERMQPPSCLTADVTGTPAKLGLSACDAPLGLEPVSGDATLECVDPPDEALRIDATSPAMHVKEAHYDFIAYATPTFGAPTPTLAVESQGSGVGPHGVEFRREATYTATWEGECLALDGSWTMDVGSKQRSTKIVGYRQCADDCPTGKIEHHAAEADVTIVLDGTVEGRWTSSRDNDGKVILACGG